MDSSKIRTILAETVQATGKKGEDEEEPSSTIMIQRIHDPKSMSTTELLQKIINILE